MKTPDVECRKILFFEDFFVSTAPILAFRDFKTDRKLHEQKERNLKFSKLFSDPKNTDFEEN